MKRLKSKQYLLNHEEEMIVLQALDMLKDFENVTYYNSGKVCTELQIRTKQLEKFCNCHCKYDLKGKLINQEDK